MKKSLLIIVAMIARFSYAGTDFDLYVFNYSASDYRLVLKRGWCWDIANATATISAFSTPVPNVPSLITHSSASFANCLGKDSKQVDVQFTPDLSSKLDIKVIRLIYHEDAWSIAYENGQTYPIYCPEKGGVINAKIVINADGRLTIFDTLGDITCTY